MKRVQTYQATVFMAGDINTAKKWLRRYCYERGFCATVTPTDFIYTGGEESGFMVGLVNYPRFPANPVNIFAQALEIAKGLIVECCQKSALVVGPEQTEWISIDPPGARKSQED